MTSREAFIVFGIWNILCASRQVAKRDGLCVCVCVYVRGALYACVFQCMCVRERLCVCVCV